MTPLALRATRGRLGTAPPDADPGAGSPTSIPGLDLVRELGTGAMGRVFVATSDRFARHVAVKLMRRDLAGDELAVRRFAREVDVLRRLDHGNLLSVLEAGTADDGSPYLVTELLDGETLAARCERGRLPAQLALGVLIQIEDALACCHAHNVVHRDLKPDNVFLTGNSERPQVKILDFGIAKLLDEVGALTAQGAALGTPCYMAPELVRGTDVGCSADVYALGVIAYELFTGILPLVADDVLDLFEKVLNQEPVSPHRLGVDVPEPLGPLIMAMLRKRAAERPRLPEVRAALNAALSRM